jgi:hypothetical protein
MTEDRSFVAGSVPPSPARSRFITSLYSRYTTSRLGLPYFDDSNALVVPIVGLSIDEANDIEAGGAAAGQVTRAVEGLVSRDELNGIRDGITTALAAVDVDSGSGRMVGLQATATGGRVRVSGSARRASKVDAIIARDGAAIIGAASNGRARLPVGDLIVSDIRDGIRVL